MKTNNLISLLLCAVVIFSACTKADYGDNIVKGDPPPVPGGFTNSDQVASANLLAYWSFDGSNNEVKSNTAPSGVLNASFTSGIKGQALRLNSGFLLYPTIAALSSPNALASCTVSMWVNISNNGSQASEFFALAKDITKQNDWLGILNIAAETGRPASDANIGFHSWIGTYPGGTRIGADNINDYGDVGKDYQLANAGGKWVQYIMRYDASSENIDLYVNNIRVSNNNFRHRAGFGPIVMPTPTQVLIGAFPTAITGFSLSGNQSWQALLNGSIDEIRVYNKAFSDLEISALFKLERQGR
ncbi:MAG: LamG-like jellyroll fold domain-containing protein [Ginsengibacter sp.]